MKRGKNMDIEKTIKNLEMRHYKVKHFPNAEDAIDFLKGEIKDTSVGIGGSQTVKELGLAEALRGQGCKIAWHWDVPGPETLKEEILSDVFLTSANAIAQTGEILNIDGRGNRLAGQVFGHGNRLYIIAGTNKICDDFESALFRAQNTAAIKNGMRFENSTPCKIDGKCHDCRSEQRICRALLVQWGPMMGQDATVVLIDGEYGY